MKINTGTRIKATASTRFDSETSPRVSDRGVQVALVALTLNLDEEGYSLGGYGYRVRKDGTVGDANRQVSFIDVPELPAEIVQALLTAAREALIAECERTLAVLSDPAATL